MRKVEEIFEVLGFSSFKIGIELSSLTVEVFEFSTFIKQISMQTKLFGV